MIQLDTQKIEKQKKAQDQQNNTYGLEVEYIQIELINVKNNNTETQNALSQEDIEKQVDYKNQIQDQQNPLEMQLVQDVQMQILQKNEINKEFKNKNENNQMQQPKDNCPDIENQFILNNQQNDNQLNQHVKRTTCSDIIIDQVIKELLEEKDKFQVYKGSILEFEKLYKKNEILSKNGASSDVYNCNLVGQTEENLVIKIVPNKKSKNDFNKYDQNDEKKLNKLKKNIQKEIINLNKIYEKINSLEEQQISDKHYKGVIKIKGIYTNSVEKEIFMIFPKANYSLMSIKQKRESFTENQALDLIKQIVTALKFIQENFQMAHRDIKLDNILVFIENNITYYVLIDFGISKCINDFISQEQTSANFGTRFYSPPEQKEQYEKEKKGEKNIDKLDYHKIDIYALGIVVLVLMNKNIKAYDLTNNSGQKIKDLLECIKDLKLKSILTGMLDGNVESRYYLNQIIIQSMDSFEENNLIEHTEINKQENEIIKGNIYYEGGSYYLGQLQGKKRFGNGEMTFKQDDQEIYKVTALWDDDILQDGEIKFQKVKENTIFKIKVKDQIFKKDSLKIQSRCQLI